MAKLENQLRDFWHPVAVAAEIGTKPYACVLLDEQLVIWRSSDGFSAFRDLCIHRGTRLSIGAVENNQLVCPYHGWTYNCHGSVTRIPAVPPERPIPSKARAVAYKCKEKYGLVFVCLGEPKQDIYVVPEFEDRSFQTHILGPVRWRAGAARSFENFIDEAHLPWAHPGLLGNRDNVPIIPSRDVKPTDRGFYFEYSSECRSRVDPSLTTTNLLTYDVDLPYALYHENIAPNGERVIDLFFTSPISDKESDRYMIVARNFGFDQPPEKFKNFTMTVWEQDRVIVETQRPEEVPIDWAEELHVRGPDDPSVLYRKQLRNLNNQSA